ncbi:mevalonate kinase family protein [Streptomyces sp. IBSNAI002]|uniref:mevalonate kinase family protein n=1 Tax=Streptomyces sp. IBSNAI002 TaxID=3457500 RepID=UPI003FD671C0
MAVTPEIRQRSVQQVPGKVILLGEHAVLYGHPAIAAPIPLSMTLTARRSLPAMPTGERQLCRALAVAASFFHIDPHTIRLHISSRIPAGAGLGSSAALSVALVRGRFVTL